MPALSVDSDTSDTYNLFVLRRLYNKDNKGRGIQGQVRRVDIHTTITPETSLTLSRHVPLGRGKYASAVIELCIRLQLAVIGAISLEKAAEELAMAFLDRSTLVTRLRQLADLIEKYKSA